MSKPISLQMYTVRELTRTPEDYRNVVRQLADIGYAGIEGSTPNDMNPIEFRRFLDDLGMRLSSTWAQPNRENLQQIVETAGIFGYDCIVGCYGSDQVRTLEATQRTADAFAEMAELLAPHGLKMLYHNHWWEFVPIDGRHPWDIIMERAPQLRCQIDTYWASNFGAVDVPKLVAKYRHRTPLLHVKDGPLVKDEANVAVGAGRMDTRACVAAADARVLQWLVVELDRFEGDIMQAVRDSYRYLSESGLGHGRR